MAEGKRASVGPKIPVATPNIGGPASIVSLETALTSCIGARIRVTTTLNTTFEGTLFTADPLTNLIAINTAPIPPTPASANTSPQPGDYQVIPISKLQSFQLLALAPEVVSATQDGGAVSFENALPEIKPVDWATIQRRERAAVERELKKDRARGRGVSKEAQSIYDALSRTLPVRWQNQSIIVSDVVVIEPPYGPEQCRTTNKDQTALQRVRKVLEMEKRKVSDRNASTKSSSTPAPAPAPSNIPAIPTALRKGG